MASNANIDIEVEILYGPTPLELSLKLSEGWTIEAAFYEVTSLFLRGNFEHSEVSGQHVVIVTRRAFNPLP